MNVGENYGVDGGLYDYQDRLGCLVVFISTHIELDDYATSSTTTLSY